MSFDRSLGAWSCFPGFLEIMPEVTSLDQILDLMLEVATVFCAMVVVPVEPAIFGPVFMSFFYGVGLSQETLLPDLKEDLGTRGVQRER